MGKKVKRLLAQVAIAQLHLKSPHDRTVPAPPAQLIPVGVQGTGETLPAALGGSETLPGTPGKHCL